MTGPAYAVALACTAARPTCGPGLPQARPRAAYATAVRSNGPSPRRRRSTSSSRARPSGPRGRDGVARRSDAVQVGLPPLLEARVGDGDRQLSPTRRRAARRPRGSRRGPRAIPRELALPRVLGLDLGDRLPQRPHRAREPARSQTVAPTQPPGRVTRFISPDSTHGVRHEVDDEAGGRDVAGGVAERERLSRTLSDVDTGEALAAGLHEGRRRTTASHVVGSEHV